MSADRSVASLLASGMALMRLDDDDTLQKVCRILQTEYYRFCARTDWQPLRRKVSLTFTGTETDGKYLPSDLIDVIAVIDYANEQTYYATEEANRYALDGKYHWFYPSAEVSPLYETTSGITVAQSASLIQGTLGSDVENEYIQLDVEPGFYKITAYSSGNSTIASKYWGPRLNDKGCVVRPRSTRKIVLVDSVGDLDGQTVYVHYWAYPLPLYQPWQIPMIDGMLLETAMKATIARDLMWNPGLASTFDVEKAYADALARNPKFLMPTWPRDRRGVKLAFGRIR